jgi:hypothetical protein
MLERAFGRAGHLPFYVALVLVGAMVMGAAPDPLKPLQWKARVLVVSAPKGEDPGLRAQDAILKRDIDGQAERDLTIIRLVGAQGPVGVDAQALRERLSLPPDRFEVALVGKDGTTVLRRRQPISLGDLFDRIDVMPMRRDEIRRRAAPPTNEPQ